MRPNPKYIEIAPNRLYEQFEDYKLVNKIMWGWTFILILTALAMVIQ